MINEIIGNYKVIELLGEGGMAKVYKAIHNHLSTQVAIKVLNTNLFFNDQIKSRFMNEAKLMSSLYHPNIIRVFDFYKTEDQMLTVMDYFDGEDLNQYIKNHGKLNDSEALLILKSLLKALQYAHERGVLHRDIKPSNIYVLKDGTVKILDFGIAKLFGQGGEMTQTGTQLGTPIYMSPEQVRGVKSIDHRSDIYSLGVTLFYALNGVSPYDSNTESQYDIMTKIVKEDLPNLNSLGVLGSYIERACQKDRELRYQSCEEWLNDLEVKKTRIEEFKPITISGHSKIDSVHIGKQEWMKKNLDVSTFRNGDQIPEAKTKEEWIQADKNNQPAWCYYDNDPVNGEKYGKLYNWYAVNDERGLAPEGWHVPSDKEWQELIDFLGGYSVSASKLKSKSNWAENGNGSDDYGFRGLPGGGRYFYGLFYSIGSNGSWWSSSEFNDKDGWLCYLNNDVLARDNSSKRNGFSVCCLRD